MSSNPAAVIVKAFSALRASLCIMYSTSNLNFAKCWWERSSIQYTLYTGKQTSHALQAQNGQKKVEKLLTICLLWTRTLETCGKYQNAKKATKAAEYHCNCFPHRMVCIRNDGSFSESNTSQFNMSTSSQQWTLQQVGKAAACPTCGARILNSAMAERSKRSTKMCPEASIRYRWSLRRLPATTKAHLFLWETMVGFLQVVANMSRWANAGPTGGGGKPRDINRRYILSNARRPKAFLDILLMHCGG